MKRLAFVVAAIAVVALIAAPAFALQERGGQAGQPGQSGERGSGGAVSRPSGGEGGRPMGGGGGSSAPAGGSGGMSSGGPSGPVGGSSMGPSGSGSSSSRMRGGDYAGRTNPRREGDYGPGRAAVPRGEGGGPSKGATAAVTGESGAAASREPIREVPQYSRPRGEKPPVGTAVPRGTVQAPRPSTGYPGGYYYPYYGYWYPYGYGYPWYGSFGLGYFYYDPCWWGGAGCYPYGAYSYPYYGAYSSRLDTGSLRLKVRPRHAEVYVDGYYVGVVDQFDGVFQRLRLETGGHRIEIRAEGYEPVVFDVLIPPFETITYTGELKKKTP